MHVGFVVEHLCIIVVSDLRSGMASNACSTHIYSAWSAFIFKMRNSGRHVDNAWAWPWQIYGLEKMITTSQALLEETRFGCVTMASYTYAFEHFKIEKLS